MIKVSKSRFSKSVLPNRFVIFPLFLQQITDDRKKSKSVKNISA